MDSVVKSLPDLIITLRDDDISAQGRRRIVDALTDCTACALAGAREEVAGPLLKVFPTFAHPTPAAHDVVLGLPLYAAPVEAAILNGAFAHALDYDDISHPAYSHPSVALLPTLYALAGPTQATGRELVSAYAVGLQAFGKLGRALNLTHTESGWHPTATFGTIASAAAACRLLRLPREQVEAALSIAASSAAGLRLNFGTMTKPLHAGYAARNGLLAARLAQNGLSAGSDPFGSKFGFARVFNPRSEINWAAFENWADLLEIDSPYGLNLKPFPACAGVHTAVEAAITLREQLGGDLSQIEKVEVGSSRVAFTALLYDDPKTELEAKFSMPYCVAVALIDGRLDLRSFTLAQITDPAVQRLMPLIRMVDDERVRDHSEIGAILNIKLRDGRTLVREVLIASGKPERWFTQAEMRRKFDDCTAHTGTPAWRARAFELLQTFDSSEPASRVIKALDLAAEQ